MNQRWKKVIVLFLGLSFFVCTFLVAAPQYGLYDFLPTSKKNEPADVTVISAGMIWEYMDGGEEPGVGNVWTTQKYDSDFWKTGRGIFKTGDSTREDGAYPIVKIHPSSADTETTSTYFFRKTINVKSVKDIKAIRGTIKYSNAAIVYLNGEIIFAGNVPAGGFSSNQETGMAERIESVQEQQFIVTNVDALRDGENVVSVEIHPYGPEQDEAYFLLESMELLEVEQEETQPDVKGLMLEVGKDESQMRINWLTDNDGFYMVQYAEAKDYANTKKPFSEIAKAVLMGRNAIEGTEQYVNRAQLTRLKTDTEYVYRVVRVGGATGSEDMRFHTGARKGFSFAVLGDPQLGAYEKDDSQLWETTLKNTVQAIGTTNFILSAGDQVDGIGSLSNTMECYEVLRSPEILKQIPIKTVMGNHEAGGEVKKVYEEQFQGLTQDEAENYWFVYLDALVVGINSNNHDYAMHREFIQQAISKTNRRWVIVVMHHSIFSGGEHSKDESMLEMREQFSDMFDDLKVDLVLSGHDHHYSRSKLQNEQTLYIGAGSSSGNKFYGKSGTDWADSAFVFEEDTPTAIRVDVSESTIDINTYTTEDGVLIDSYQLSK